ncbi:methyl jasmonate esterase 1-like [Solanum dulcamara]|uniref:methyl jasmonate esterase 1-like n=1 Tax=Solanum dulcamara TaxID=45834 RepID=UPI0024861D91|nr:methyl jasmonate esterase 1-like [Solanum dulcamara]
MVKSKFLTSLVVLILLLPYANATLPGPKAKKHLVLVHRACHGAWSWYKIVALMRSSGYNVTAIDLAASGINPKQALEVPHLSDYFNPLMKFMDSLPQHEKVVLVGHEFGGFAISKAMEIFPEKISVAVFVTAVMPGQTLNATRIYTEDFVLATTVLRPIYIYSVEDVSKEIVVSSRRYGSVRRVFIVAAEDNLLKKEFQKWTIEKNPPDDVEEIHGSNHMTMMSKPLQLSTSIANKYI